ncbi:MAG: metallophosphoesterase family protein [Thermocladium sp.]
MMRLLFISDLHKTLENLDEMESVDWLLRVLDDVKPDYLLSAGDTGEALTLEDIERISSRTKPILIYGNHENFSIIKDFAIKDGQLIKAGNLRITGVNGLVEGEKRREYSFNVEKLFRLIPKIRGVDIFISHQPPYLPDVYSKMKYDEGIWRFTEFLHEVQPKLHLNGHMSAGCYSHYKFPWGGVYLRVESSASYRCYAIIENEDVTVYEDGEEVFKLRWEIGGSREVG